MRCSARPAGATCAPWAADQSNTSLVFDSALVLKAFRRLEAGDNPELEMLRFLTARGFPNIAALGGWYELQSDLMDATLGVVQRYIEGGRDGWELTLDQLASVPDGDPGAPARARRRHRGACTPPWAPTPPTPRSRPRSPAPRGCRCSRRRSTSRSSVRSSTSRATTRRSRRSPVAARRFASDCGCSRTWARAAGSSATTATCTSGQTLLADAGWIILDFEGEPARPLRERRRKRSPLRDVAGMLRSIAYVASAAELQRGVTVPDGWEERSREAFLEGYLAAVEPSLLPPGEAATAQLLSIFELEKAVYELRYELNNRPDWVRIPVAGIVRLLEEPV